MTTVALAMAPLTMVVALPALAAARTRRVRERGTFAGLLQELAAIKTPLMTARRPRTGAR